jgi:hypothetical protein
MKTRIALAAAAMLAASVAAPAFAGEAQFRSAAPQTFTAQDLQNYGLNAKDANQVTAMQEQGYKVQVMSQEEARQYRAGLSDTTWFILGGAAVVIIILAVS